MAVREGDTLGWFWIGNHGALDRDFGWKRGDNGADQVWDVSPAGAFERLVAHQANQASSKRIQGRNPTHPGICMTRCLRP